MIDTMGGLWKQESPIRTDSDRIRGNWIGRELLNCQVFSTLYLVRVAFCWHNDELCLERLILKLKLIQKLTKVSVTKGGDI